MPIDTSLLIDPQRYDQIAFSGNRHDVLESAQNAGIIALVAAVEGGILSHSSAAPAAAPADTTQTAFHMDEALDQLYYWNVTAQQWRRLL